jgi:intergrase/recombinase
MLPDSIRNNAIKSLIVLSKYLGVYENFRSKLKNHGIKTKNQDSFTSFLRILNVNNNSNNILEWYKTAISNVRNNEKTLLKYLLFSGIRKEEAIKSFNKIIELHKLNRLNEYYDTNLNCLMHFRYPKEFIRKTKNCFITFINIDLLNEIANSEPVSYQALIKRLRRKGIKCRINELRDFYGTYLLQHQILEAEINLCQGRIPPSIFIKHYWSPKLSELRDRIFKALENLDKSI